MMGPVCGPTAPRRPLWRLAGCRRMLATQGRRPAASAGDAAPCREIGKKKFPCAAGPREVAAAALVHGRRRENLRPELKLP